MGFMQHSIVQHYTDLVIYLFLHYHVDALSPFFSRVDMVSLMVARSDRSFEVFQSVTHTACTRTRTCSGLRLFKCCMREAGGCLVRSPICRSFGRRSISGSRCIALHSRCTTSLLHLSSFSQLLFFTSRHSHFGFSGQSVSTDLVFLPLIRRLLDASVVEVFSVQLRCLV
jgi:hypothetical protein